MTNNTPPPGSDKAIDQGCTCAVLDNAHGRGAYGGIKGEDGKPLYWITVTCPIHGERDSDELDIDYLDGA